MNFIRQLKPFQFLNALTKDSPKGKDNEAQPAGDKDSKAVAQQQKTNLSLTQQSQPEQEEEDSCLTFLLGLRQSGRAQAASFATRKLQKNVFQDLEIEPHYLVPAQPEKLIEFEFHLGIEGFLERTEDLHQQWTVINKTMKQTIAHNQDGIPLFFETLDSSQQELSTLIDRIMQQKQKIRGFRVLQAEKVTEIIRRKAVIKQKISLLKKVKFKNEAAFLEITNIDQAFATEQNRCKLYNKISQLSKLENSLYVGTIKNKLVSTARKVRDIIQKGIEQWVSGRLSTKHIEKVAFVIYFMERQRIYRDNSIDIDYKKHGEALRSEVQKLSEWKEYRYVKDGSTRARIGEFLSLLARKMGDNA